MGNVILRLSVMFFGLLLFQGCDFNNKKTTMEVTDPDRHYYPVLMGQSLNIVYEISNTGNYPLIIEDIQTSCGCVSVEESSFKVLPAGGKGYIRLKYDSNENIGYIKHFITFYANLEAADSFEMTFDLNVYPVTSYPANYKELYGEYQRKYYNVETPAHGNKNGKGYYLDESTW